MKSSEYVRLLVRRRAFSYLGPNYYDDRWIQQSVRIITFGGYELNLMWSGLLGSGPDWDNVL